MWYLKFKFKHSDCIYNDKVDELGLSVFFWPVRSYIKENYVYITIIQQLIGEKRKIKKYIDYLKKHPKIVKVEENKNTIVTLAKHKTEYKLYDSIYNPEFLIPAPCYNDKDGYEIIEIACWNQKPLQELIKSLRENKTTTHFEILKFSPDSLEELYVTKLMPDLPPKQKQAIILAYKEGYYDYPRKTDLGKLSKICKVSKPTFRENLKKAEKKLLPTLIPK